MKKARQASVKDGMLQGGQAATTDMPQAGGNAALTEQLTDAGTQEMLDGPIQPNTEKPEAVNPQAAMQVSQELLVVFAPKRMHFMLARGHQTLDVSAQEMAGILGLSALANLAAGGK